MKKSRNRIIFYQVMILFILGLPLCFNMKHYNLKNVKALMQKESNIISFANAFFGNMTLDKAEEVSKTKISVKDYSLNDDTLTITFLSDKVYAVFDGMIYEKGNNYLKLYDKNDNHYEIANIESNHGIFSYISYNELIGKGQVITICGDNILELASNLVISYDEI